VPDSAGTIVTGGDKGYFHEMTGNLFSTKSSKLFLKNLAFFYNLTDFTFIKHK
jgi:hypothetical protein